MIRTSLDFYGEMPQDMKNYLRHYGWHFNKHACEWAVSLMKRRNPTTGKPEKLEKMSKEQVEKLLEKYGVKLENAVAYDPVFVANMVKADSWMSSIDDERHLALAIKDHIDDIDKPDGYIMHRWYADMVREGMPIEWDDIL